MANSTPPAPTQKLTTAGADWQPRLRMPLDGKTAGGALNLCEISRCAINLRGDGADESFRRAVSEALSGELPTTPNTTAQLGDVLALWLGPDEWLLRADNAKRAALLAALQKALTATVAAVVEVSDYYTIIEISGTQARDALAAACPLDLHPPQFQTGACAQSHYAAAAILLNQSDDTPTYHLQVRWSYAAYVWEYLRTVAGAEV